MRGLVSDEGRATGYCLPVITELALLVLNGLSIGVIKVKVL